MIISLFNNSILNSYVPSFYKTTKFTKIVSFSDLYFELACTNDTIFFNLLF